MIAGFVFAAYLQLSMISGFTFLPDTTILGTQEYRPKVNLPPQAIEIGVSGERDLGPFHLNLFGETVTYMSVNNIDSASVLSLSWAAGIKLSYKNIDIGYTRSCHHPFSPFVVETTNTAEGLSASSHEGVSRQFYIRFRIGGEE